MSFYFKTADDFHEFAKQWNLTAHKGEVNWNDPNVFLRKYEKNNAGGQEYITLMGVVKSLMSEIVSLKEHVEKLEKHSDARDDELKAHNEQQDEKIDKSWDVMSDRIADLELVYQQKGYLSYESHEDEPEEADAKPRKKVRK